MTVCVYLRRPIVEAGRQWAVVQMGSERDLFVFESVVRLLPKKIQLALRFALLIFHFCNTHRSLATFQLISLISYIIKLKASMQTDTLALPLSLPHVHTYVHHFCPFPSSTTATCTGICVSLSLFLSPFWFHIFGFIYSYEQYENNYAEDSKSESKRL